MQNTVHSLFPAGVCLSQWNPHDLVLAEQIREYCLATVKEVYGFDYREDWHRDLDSLLLGEASDYAHGQRGCMLVLQNEKGEVIGTAGMRGLFWKPNMVEMFQERYGDCQQVASNWRMYIRADYRKQGMGKILVTLREMAAIRYGYTRMYLHCDINAIRLRNHWEVLGFSNFCNEGQTAHYDKELSERMFELKKAS